MHCGQLCPPSIAALLLSADWCHMLEQDVLLEFACCLMSTAEDTRGGSPSATGEGQGGIAFFLLVPLQGLLVPDYGV